MNPAKVSLSIYSIVFKTKTLHETTYCCLIYSHQKLGNYLDNPLIGEWMKKKCSISLQWDIIQQKFFKKSFQVSKRLEGNWVEYC